MSEHGGREVFLGRITGALQRAPNRIEEASAVTILEAGSEVSPERLVTLMMAALETVDARLHRAESEEEARRCVLEIAHERGVERAVLCGSPELTELGLEEALRDAGISVAGPGLEPEKLRQAAIEADMGVSGVDYAVAETGSLVLVADADVPRSATALPPIHVAVVGVERLVPTLERVLALLKECLLAENGIWTSSCVTFITGPSRTADIEQTLTIGVHGPGEVHVVLVGTQEPKSLS